jgi:hypothetical protein
MLMHDELAEEVGTVNDTNAEGRSRVFEPYGVLARPGRSTFCVCDRSSTSRLTGRGN